VDVFSTQCNTKLADDCYACYAVTLGDKYVGEQIEQMKLQHNANCGLLATNEKH